MESKISKSISCFEFIQQYLLSFCVKEIMNLTNLVFKNELNENANSSNDKFKSIYDTKSLKSVNDNYNDKMNTIKYLVYCLFLINIISIKKFVIFRLSIIFFGYQREDK